MSSPLAVCYDGVVISFERHLVRSKTEITTTRRMSPRSRRIVMTSQNNKQDGTTSGLKKLCVDLLAHETLLQKRQIVVQVPSDCDPEEIKELTVDELDYLADQFQCDSYWETEDRYGVEPFDVDVEVCKLDGAEADLTFARNERGELVAIHPAT
jgi:hypothetical protein